MKDKELREKLENTINREVYKCGHGQTDGILITDESFDVKIANAVLDLIQSEVEKERKRVLNKVSYLQKHMFDPVGGISNMKYIRVSDIDQLRKDTNER